MQRREFLKAGGMSLAASAASAAFARAPEPDAAPRRFKLNYAPHFGMFEASAGTDLNDQLRFAADHGFTAWEDNGMKNRSVDDQEKIARTMDRLGMTMGVFVAAGAGAFDKVTFARQDPAVWNAVLDEIRESVEVAKRVNARWMTVVPGRYDDRLEWDYQTANCIELLKRCCEIFEPHGYVMVLEPLNWWTDHPGLFLHKIPQAYQICRAVGSPACKILFDVYHQQITEGNLIPNMDRAWDEIAYFQVGDNPGRKEPGTGEINFRNLFRHLHDRAFTGLVGMEHGNSRPGRHGEQAVIDAYLAVDTF